MGSDDLGIAEKAVLLALMTFAREASNSDLYDRYRFRVDKKVRERLTSLGYITWNKTGTHRTIVHTLTDSGWAQCRVELGGSVPAGAHRAYRLLFGVLRCLESYLVRSHLEVADLFKGDDGDGGGDLGERIQLTYRELASRPGAWVGLARLRSALDGVGRQDVDEALLRLDLVPGVYLVPEANQKVLTDEDRAAAIRIGDEDKHLLSIESS